MKKLYGLFFVSCIVALAVSSGIADAQPATPKDGIKVRVQYDPQGPNNWVVATITFINENQYRVDINWRPVITCEDGSTRDGVFPSFTMNPRETSWANIGRFGACGQGRIKNIEVEMDVKRAGP